MTVDYSIALPHNVTMKINGFTPIAGASSAKRRKGASESSGGFLDFLDGASKEEEDAVEEAPPAAPTSPLASVNSLLSLQEIPEDEVRKKKALMHSNATLEALEELRHALLMGEVPVHILKQIGSLLAEQRQQIDDPRLLGIMDDIELRAAVELAKYEQSQA